MRTYIYFFVLTYGLVTSLYGSDYAAKAALRPIAFSVVREDAEQDLAILERYFREEKASVLMVASGGCTAALLAAKAKIKDLTLVDPNPAQLALSKFKLNLLTVSSIRRKEILGHLPMDAQKRKKIMQGYMEALDINPDVFGDLDAVASFGLDHAGRYEKVFEQLRAQLASHRDELEKLFSFAEVGLQSAYVAPGTPLGDALDTALDDVMSQANLVTIFGDKATANRLQEFSRHFASRIRVYLTNHLASSSPWLASMLLGQFDTSMPFPWINVASTSLLPEVKYFQGFMNDALEACAPESYHLVHLSNIIDWLSQEEAEKTLQLAYRALKPGGAVVIRQLNSNVDIIALGKDFNWDVKASNEFLYNDRSFFYRKFLLGFKKKISAAPKVTALADDALIQTPVIQGSFFRDLAIMDIVRFKAVQGQFFFAVDYFSRPMAALIARLPNHSDRVDIIHNIVEEHGDFSVGQYHSNTFKQFLRTIGFRTLEIEELKPSSVVNMFNYTLMAASALEDPLVGIACNGIIEYAFADISALIAKTVVERGWVFKQDLVHYNLHADIDKEHAEDFFKIIEPSVDEPSSRTKIIAGLQLGAYIFNRLYEDLYAASKLG